MFFVADYAEYLDEVREQVCGRCPGRDPERYPWPGCGDCGVELRLSGLVGTIHDAEGFDGLDPALLERLVGAVRSVDERRRQWELVRRRAARPSRKDRVPVAEIIRAYEAETGTCIGCD
jgi:hypothetical protein